MEQADFSAGKGESAMGQNYFRIDDRLIHGQIVTAWCSHLNIQEIIAIDDTLAGNSMLQSIMLMGVPKQYKSCVVTMAQAKELFRLQPTVCHPLPPRPDSFSGGAKALRNRYYRQCSKASRGEVQPDKRRRQRLFCQ